METTTAIQSGPVLVAVMEEDWAVIKAEEEEEDWVVIKVEEDLAVIKAEEEEEAVVGLAVEVVVDTEEVVVVDTEEVGEDKAEAAVGGATDADQKLFKS
jgi:hypothetical protein